MSLDLTYLEAAVIQLEKVLTLCNLEPYKSDPLLRMPLRTATIKTFEYTYAISLKMIKRYIEKMSIEPDEVDNMTFNNLIREAFSKDLVQSDVPVWRDYRKMRGTTNHAYDEEKAQEIFDMTPDFLKEVRYILARLEERNKQIGQSD